MSVIEIKNLNKDYKMYNSKKARLLELILPAYKNHSTFRAINDMNLEVNKGEILGKLGKNGAGKTHILKFLYASGVLLRSFQANNDGVAREASDDERKIFKNVCSKLLILYIIIYLELKIIKGFGD